MFDTAGLMDSLKTKSEFAELGKNNTKPQSLISVCRKRKIFGFLLTFAVKTWLVHGVFRFQRRSGAFPLPTLPQCTGIRCCCCTKPSLQAEEWRHEDVPVHVGGRAGCREGLWSPMGCKTIPAEAFKLLKGTLKRCHYKTELCRIDLGSDVMARSGGDVSADGEPLLLPVGG